MIAWLRYTPHSQLLLYLARGWVILHLRAHGAREKGSTKASRTSESRTTWG